MPLSIMLAIYIGFNWYDGIILPTQYYLVFVLSLGIFLWSARKLGGTDLERAISILDFVQGNPAILIRMRVGWYAEEFLKTNPVAKVVGQKHKESLSND